MLRGGQGREARPLRRAARLRSAGGRERRRLDAARVARRFQFAEATLRSLGSPIWDRAHHAWGKRVKSKHCGGRREPALAATRPLQRGKCNNNAASVPQASVQPAFLSS